MTHGSPMYQVSCRSPIPAHFTAPPSKPETQRALIMGTLAAGISVIRSPLLARETRLMMEACRSLDATVHQADGHIQVRGIYPDAASSVTSNSELSLTPRYIWAGGSALVARVFLTLGSALPQDVIIDGTENLRGRPFQTLIDALRDKGVEFKFFGGHDRLPCAVTSGTFPGGRYRIGTDISSQFATALIVSAPLASGPLSIELCGENHSLSYIRQTIEMSAQFGVTIEVDYESGRILIPGGQRYSAADVEVSGDFTSVSYILGTAFVTRGGITVSGLDPASQQGERMIIPILQELGARITWGPDDGSLSADCSHIPSKVEATFDLRDSPNILPTVAAISATVPGRVRIIGGKVTQNHKSPRIEMVARELSKAGVPVEVIKDDAGWIDGLEIRGAESHEGGTVFSCHQDHRIVMSMMVFSLACRHPCSFAIQPDTEDSFPGFAELMNANSSLNTATALS